MENHINLSQPTNHYLQHFYVALTNFEQQVQEDRERRKQARLKKAKQKQYE
ncbi:MAG: hypothetical protein ACOYW3_13030 [Bacteroidota bacterium]